MKDYRELIVWQRSHVLTLAIYRATKTFPKDELFGLTSQLRRSAASIPANIAEGCGRDGDAELKRFPKIALGSAAKWITSSCSQLGSNTSMGSKTATLPGETLEIRQLLGAFGQKLKA